MVRLRGRALPVVVARDAPDLSFFPQPVSPEVGVRTRLHGVVSGNATYQDLGTDHCFLVPGMTTEEHWRQSERPGPGGAHLRRIAKSPATADMLSSMLPTVGSVHVGNKEGLVAFEMFLTLLAVVST